VRSGMWNPRYLARNARWVYPYTAGCVLTIGRPVALSDLKGEVVQAQTAGQQLSSPCALIVKGP
jgi:hypothetical protein